MTLLPIVCSANVENGSDQVEVTGTDASTGLGVLLTDINCRPNATVFIAGVGYLVKARLDTTHFQIERDYEGANASGVSCSIAPFTPEMANRAELATSLRTFSARDAVMKARGNGLHYVSLGATGLADPGHGKVSYVGASWATATGICVDVIDAVGRNRAGLIDRWEPGDTLTVESIETSAYVAYELTQAPTNEGPDAWRKLLDFVVVAFDGAIVDEEDVRLVLRAGGTPGPAYDADAEAADPAGLAAFEGEAGGYRVFVLDLCATEFGSYAGRSGVVEWNGTDTWTLIAVYTGPKGGVGDQGDKGWSPQLVGESDGERRVLKLAGYVGGAGTAPTANVGEYLKADGTFTAIVDEAMDVRGAPGANGAGTVASVVEGTGISVDSTDPTAPLVNVVAFTGDSGAGGVLGGVPAPTAGDAAAGKVLGAGGGWVAAASTSISLRQRVVDFHFGCARGVGFINGVDTGTIAYTLSAPASVGALSFSYTGTAPGTGQLIVLLGTDSEYYTVVVASSSAGTCSLLEPLPCAVSVGQNAWSFWDTDFHPNEYGYNALADHALRQETGVWKKIYQRPPRIDPPSTVVVNATNAFGNPGSVSSGYGWTVTPSGAGGGVRYDFEPPKTGIYRLSFQCSKVTTGTADIDLTIVHDGTTIVTSTIKTATAGLHEVEFFAPGKVTISLTRTANAFLVSDMSIFSREEMSLSSIDFGNHMVLGDSWVADAGGPAARITARLTNAAVSKSGEGGDDAGDLIARFDTDVTAAGPFDFVWVIIGTNDISAAVTAPVFAKNIAILINKIQEIGATPIIFTPFPGSSNYTATMDLARVYMATIAFNEQNARKVTRHNISSYCTASVDTPLLSLGIRNDKFRVVEVFLNLATNFKEAGTHPGTTAIAAVPAGYSVTPITVTPNPAGRFVQLLRTAGGTAEVCTGYIDIESPLE